MDKELQYDYKGVERADTITVGFAKVNKESEAILPQREYDDSIGYDLCIPVGVTVKQGGGVVPLGFSVSLPKGVGMFVMSRSGVAVKGVLGWDSEKDYLDGAESKRYKCNVKLGLVDPGYSGEVGIIVENNDRQFYLPPETSIAQAVFIRTLGVEWNVMSEHINNSERGNKCFAS